MPDGLSALMTLSANRLTTTPTGEPVWGNNYPSPNPIRFPQCRFADDAGAMKPKKPHPAVGRMDSEADAVKAAEVAESATLPEKLNVSCSYCGRFRGRGGRWVPSPKLTAEELRQVSHSICPACYRRHVKPQLLELEKLLAEQPKIVLHVEPAANEPDEGGEDETGK